MVKRGLRRFIILKFIGVRGQLQNGPEGGVDTKSYTLALLLVATLRAVWEICQYKSEN